jgi:DNA-binding response OmpR family regulator
VTVTVKITALPIYVAAPFRVKLKSQTFTTYGLIVRKDINFSVKEFDVLYMLYSNPGLLLNNRFMKQFGMKKQMVISTPWKTLFFKYARR